jgi:hypothetical protein
MAPCLLGYAAVGHMLKSHMHTKKDGNAYWRWIEAYSGEEYGKAVMMGSRTSLRPLSGKVAVEELIIGLTTQSFWKRMSCYNHLTGSRNSLRSS